MKGTVSPNSTDENVLIELDQNAAVEDNCSGCGLRHHCTLPSQRTVRIHKSELNEDIMPGDPVDVEVKPSVVVWLSVSVYMVPLLLLVAGGLLASEWGEWYAVLGAMSGLILGLMGNIALNKWIPIRKIISVKKRC